MFFSEDALEAYCLDATERALDFIMDDFLANRSPSSFSNGSTSGRGSSGRATPVSSFADSGVSSNVSHSLPLLSDSDGCFDESRHVPSSPEFEFNLDLGVLDIPSLGLFGGDTVQFPEFGSHENNAAPPDSFMEDWNSSTWNFETG